MISHAFFPQKHQNDLWMGVVLRCSNNSYKRKGKLVGEFRGAGHYFYYWHGTFCWYSKPILLKKCLMTLHLLLRRPKWNRLLELQEEIVYVSSAPSSRPTKPIVRALYHRAVAPQGGNVWLNMFCRETWLICPCFSVCGRATSSA